MQDIDAHVDDVGDDVADRAVGVEGKVHAGGVDGVTQDLHPAADEGPPVSRRHQQAGLRAVVIGEPDALDVQLRPIERQIAQQHVQDAVQELVHERRVQDQVAQQSDHAAQEGRLLPQRAELGDAVAAGVCLRFIAHVGDGRRRPGLGEAVAIQGRPAQGRRLDLPARVAHAMPADVPHIGVFAAGEQVRIGQILGGGIGDPGDVVAQDGIQVVDAEVLAQLGRGRRLAGDVVRHAAGLAVRDGIQHQVAAGVVDRVHGGTSWAGRGRAPGRCG